jgi:hypothetical protein
MSARPRLLAALGAAAFLAATHLAWPEPGPRAAAQYALVITLGWGHLLAAALPSARRLRSRGALACASALLAAATAFALYTTAARAWPPLALGLAALSVWHIAENDAAIARALRSGGPLPPLPRHARGHALPLAASALVLAVAGAALPDAGRFGDVFSAVTLHHLLAWLGLRIARGASLLRLAALHAGPALACAALWLAPPAAEPLRTFAFSPGVYLFWSALHALQTARARAG